MRLVFIGPPGVGKGTQSERLVRHLGIVHLSTGEMLREACSKQTELGKKADRYMETGQLVPDELMLELVSQRLEAPDCQQGYLLDGFPRTLCQAKALDAILTERNTPLDLVLELTADADELIRRLAARGRKDDQPEIVRLRLEEYERQTAPLCDYYGRQNLLRTVDGQGTPDEVFVRIKTIVDSLGPSGRVQ
jgi:adenylate kinase